LRKRGVGGDGLGQWGRFGDSRRSRGSRSLGGRCGERGFKVGSRIGVWPLELGEPRAQLAQLALRGRSNDQCSDGDHKLLAVPADDPEQRLDGVRERIWDWYVALGKPVTRWAGEDAALALIPSCPRATEASEEAAGGH